MTGLEFDPFTDEEWVAKGKMVPKKDKERKMSLLGKGAFMSTFRKKGTGYLFPARAARGTIHFSLGGLPPHRSPLACKRSMR